MSDEPRLARILKGEEVEWPPPREEPREEPSHRAARLADRASGLERGDVLDADRPNG